MNKIEYINTVIFDFDGTLHDINYLYYSVINKVLEEENISGKISLNKAKTYLGYSPIDMWNDFMPEIDISLKNKLIKKVGTNLEKNILENKSHLYNGSINVLDELKKSNKDLIIISNCTNSYKEKVINRFNLEKYFKNFYTSEEYGFLPKEYILKDIMPKYKKDYIFIGDRFHDIKAANENNIKSIFCSYGYGKKEESIGASYIIDEISEVLNYL